MDRIKSIIKKIPIIGDILVSIKIGFKRKTPAIQGSNNNIINKGVLDKVVFDIIGNDNSIEIGRNTHIKDTLVYIRGDNHRLIIADHCYFGGGEMWMEDSNCSLLIHEYTTVEKAHLAVTESFSVLEIHKDCMLAKYVEIRTGDSHSIVDKETGKRINSAASVCLEEHVWIGAHTKVLKGVTIGNNTVIGTASVVTNDIPAFSVAAGIPAKPIRSGVDWKRERI
jgi:acetyltransferase-like isoleucine patch superfamily enzyme